MEIIMGLGGRPSVTKRNMYSGNIIKVIPKPRNNRTVETKSVIVVWLVE
jgi:hypothetical protein